MKTLWQTKENKKNRLKYLVEKRPHRHLSGELLTPEKISEKISLYEEMVRLEQELVFGRHSDFTVR